MFPELFPTEFLYDATILSRSYTNVEKRLVVLLYGSVASPSSKIEASHLHLGH